MTDERPGRRPTPRGSDDPLDREIRRLLAVDPSPAFEARVRARVAGEPPPGAWSAGRLWTAFGAAAALALAVAVFRPEPLSDTGAGPAAVVTPTGEASPASSATAGRPRQDRPAANGPLASTAGPTVATGGTFAGPPRAAAPSGPPRFTRVVFSERERGALRQLLTLARDQPVVLPVLAGARAPVAGEPPAALVIPPIAIEPAVELAIPRITIEPLNLTLLDTGEVE